MGGRSAEREISLRTGRGIAQALRNLGHEVLSIDAADGAAAAGRRRGARRAPPRPCGAAARRASAAIANVPALARRRRGVHRAARLARARTARCRRCSTWPGKPYTGSGVLASALAMDKAMSKRVFERDGVPTPHVAVLLAAGAAPAAASTSRRSAGYPLVVKPNAEGSTVGLTIVEHAAELRRRRSTARAEFDAQVLVEQYIDGPRAHGRGARREVLPDRRDRAQERASTTTSPSTPTGASDYFCPAELPEPVAERVARARPARGAGARLPRRVRASTSA